MVVFIHSFVFLKKWLFLFFSRFIKNDQTWLIYCSLHSRDKYDAGYLLYFVVVVVDGVHCDTTFSTVEIKKPINPIICSDMYNNPLVISPSLPGGLVFENNTIYGVSTECRELVAYTITSIAENTNSFIIQLGSKNSSASIHIVLCVPSTIFINEEDLYIIRHVPLDGIKIHSNTVYSTIHSSVLPEGLVIDKGRGMIVGAYTGEYTGFFKCTLSISNNLGTRVFSFQFILSSMQMNGLSYSIFDVPCDMKRPLIESLTTVKEGFLLTTDIPSSSVSSSLYMPTAACQLLLFSATLHIHQSGYYSFRMTDDSLLTHVCSFFYSKL